MRTTIAVVAAIVTATADAASRPTIPATRSTTACPARRLARPVLLVRNRETAGRNANGYSSVIACSKNVAGAGFSAGAAA